MLCFDSLIGCASKEDLCLEAGRLALQLGFEGWSFSVKMASASGAGVSDWCLGNLDGDPAPVLAEHEPDADPVEGDLRRCGVPYCWLQREDAGGPARAAYRGLSVPIQALGELEGCFTLATRRPAAASELDAARAMALLFSRYLYLACLPHIGEFRRSHSPQLRPREVECLSWAARGKTTWEIGRVLDISEHTVVYHLRNAAEKLQAVNRQQAITKSIQLGILSTALASADRGRGAGYRQSQPLGA